MPADRRVYLWRPRGRPPLVVIPLADQEHTLPVEDARELAGEILRAVEESERPPDLDDDTEDP